MEPEQGQGQGQGQEQEGQGRGRGKREKLKRNQRTGDRENDDLSPDNNMSLLTWETSVDGERSEGISVSRCCCTATRDASAIDFKRYF
eukprot:764793-Hanusia_phi.AAC.4